MEKTSSENVNIYINLVEDSLINNVTNELIQHSPEMTSPKKTL